MRTLDYQTSGTCSRAIHITLTDDDRLESVTFDGGCHGNLQGIGALVHGMKRADVIARLRGIDCKARGTSCPDQLARALESAVG
ncbi:MAG: TIGR03905 family TSCPD domain-containing protein [Bacteroidaceae bacterium]|nr:TIGR03905 family TSCPD domain-containing protein [Bacteroidaceae bacterium]